MIGRRATVGLSLLCALLFSAIAVQSAAATAGTNITAFQCKQEFFSGFDFKDAHCDINSGPFHNGKFNHVAIAIGLSTEIGATNETTGGAKSTQILEGSPFKVPTKIECTTLTGTGTVENSEPSSKVHKLTGKGTAEYSGCTVVSPLNCTVKEPIVVKIGSVESQEGIEGPKKEANAMGLEFKAEAGKPLTTITLEGAGCPLEGAPFPVEGSTIATSGPGESEAQTNKWSGATGSFTLAMGQLNAATRVAQYKGTVTYYKKLTQQALAYTTIT